MSKEKILTLRYKVNSMSDALNLIAQFDADKIMSVSYEDMLYEKKPIISYKEPRRRASDEC